MLDVDSLSLLEEAVGKLNEGFADLPPVVVPSDSQRIRAVLLEAAERMQDNYPYAHPLYAGQMLKPPHPVARLAYAMSMFVNPNNHALDGGRASSQLEKEAVAELASMFGYQEHLGHLCSGGTMANLEALWIAGKLHPDKLIVASQQAHYTHNRISEVLKIPFQSIPTDARGRMDVAELVKVLDTGRVGTVVVTPGTTAIGSVDPLPEILQLKSKYNFRIHLDAAYGGYFKLVDNLDEHATRTLSLTGEADSIVIDPHKHGLQPYGCGCIMFKDPSVGQFYKHDSPYTYFSSEELHLGEITLECSRPGSAAVALWCTQKMFPLQPAGEFAANLSCSRQAAMDLYGLLRQDDRFVVPFAPELDIVCFAVKAPSASASSALAREIFRRAADLGLHLAVASLPRHFFEDRWTNVVWDADQVACLRSCLMKPEHLDWVDVIHGLIGDATKLALESAVPV